MKVSFFILISTFVFCFLGLFPAQGNAQSSNLCSYPNLVEWPAKKPVWKLCWVPPEQSSGINASGLEIRNVYYRGKLVLNRGNIPVLNVEYEKDGCGGQYNTYRDWLGAPQAFEANNVIQAGYAEPTQKPVTVCDHPGRDSGKFTGVAVEKSEDKLILTSQLKSAWYRYIIKWVFYPNGTIEPRIGFSAVDYFCTENLHTHHAYWRFDIDLLDSNNDIVEEFNNGKWTAMNETSRNRNLLTKRKWRVRDTAKNAVMEIAPGENDIKADSFAMGDFWALSYNAKELDDGGALRGPTGDRFHIDRFVNNEPIIKGKSNVVVWYRSGTNHDGDGHRCDTVGPVLKILLNRK